MKTRTITKITGLLAASVLALSACGSNSGSGNGSTEAAGGNEADSKWENCTPGSDSKDVSSEKADDNKNITIGAFNGWDESFAAAHLMKKALTDDGYTVDIKSFDAAPGYTAVAKGDVDFLMDSWLPLTHADYIKQYGDDMESQGCWYNNAKLTIAVNEDSPAKTIEDLKSMGGDYDNTLYGIEPGAGLTKTTKQAITDYDLSNLDFKISTTPAMLAQLKKDTEAKKNVAVTLWRPHWAYSAFPVRDLEDPKGVMGKAEIIYNFSKKGFTESNPKVAQLLKNFVLDDKNLSSLEEVMFSSDKYNGKDNDKAVDEWVKANPDFLKQWQAGKLAESK